MSIIIDDSQDMNTSQYWGSQRLSESVRDSYNGRSYTFSFLN